MPHHARVIAEADGTRQVVAVVSGADSGPYEIVARLEGPADAVTLARARVMADALDGRLTFVLEDWRKGDGEGFDELGEAARATHVAMMEATGSGCCLSIRPAGHEGDPDDACLSMSIERNAGALWLGVGPEGGDALASILVGPKGALMQPCTGDLGLMVLSAEASGRYLNRVEQVRCIDDTYAREAIGAEARPEAAPPARIV